MMDKNNYFDIVTEEFMNSHLQFMEKNHLDISLEASGKNSLMQKPGLQLTLASLYYIFTNMIKSCKVALTKFSHSITSFLDNIAITIGVSSEQCIDHNNICGFIDMNAERIKKMNQEVNEAIKNFMKYSKKPDKFINYIDTMNKRIKLFNVDFLRWKRNGKPVTIETVELKKEIVMIKSFIVELDKSKLILDEIMHDADSNKENISQEQLNSITKIIEVINLMMTTYSSIAFELKGSLNIVNGAIVSAANAVKMINPKNHYNDDVDIQLLK